MQSFILKRNHHLETFLLVVHINDKLPKTIRKGFFGLLRVLKSCQDEPRHAIGFVRRTSPRRVKMRPLNSASLRRASNAPIPLSIAHARTRAQTQHSRQGRGRGLGPLKVSDPGLVQPGRVPERLPVPGLALPRCWSAFLTI